MEIQDSLENLYTLGDPIGNIAEFTSDTLSGTAYATGAVGRAGKASVDTTKHVGHGIYEAGAATSDGLKYAYDAHVDFALKARKEMIKSIADWSNNEMKNIEPSPTLTPNEQITSHMF